MDVAFVGRLTKQDLVAAALATVWFDLWNSSIVGFMTAIDTILAQSYGAKEYETFCILTGNLLVIVFGVTCFMSGVLALCGPVMHLVGQDHALADAAGEFSYWLIPGLFLYYLFKVLTKYLQTQNQLASGVWIGMLANGMNALFNWAMIFRAGWGLYGAPWATSLTRTVEFLLIVGYTRFWKSSLKTTWPKFSRVDFRYKNLKLFWKLAILGALLRCAAAWSYQITTIMAALIGVVALNAHVITLNVIMFIYLSFPFEIGIATSICVGQLIGEKHTKDAEQSSHALLLLSGAVQIILGIILYFCKDIVADLFSKDEEVSNMVSELIPIACVFQLGVAVVAVNKGVLRGLGKQKVILWLSLLGDWVCPIPIGAVLTFVVGLGVKGLWWAINIGIYAFALFSFCFLQMRIDWEQECKKAMV